jgi:excisionase family DNA binding protein
MTIQNASDVTRDSLPPGVAAFTVQDVAEILRTSESAVYRAIKRKTLHTVAGLGRLIVPRAELLRFLEALR